MASYEGFEESGFLSGGTTNDIARVRAENNDWFKLAEDMNEALMRTATALTNAVKTTTWAPEAVAVRVLMRSCGTLQGIVLLTERGLVAEGRNLVRSLLENAFCIAALVDDPETFTKMLRDDSEASRQRQRKFIDVQNLIADGAAREKLQADIIDFGKIQHMNLRDIAERGAVLTMYLAFLRLSDDAAHLSAKSLHRHVRKDPTGSGWHYNWCIGDQDENASTLHLTILAALAIGVGISEMLEEVIGNAEFGDLADRFQSMPRAPVV